MAEIVVMPALGNSVETCLIVGWAVKEGDVVQEGDVLCDVETDKATMEVPSTASGTILKVLYAEGDEVPVKVPLLVVGEQGEDPAGVLAEAGVGAEESASDAASDAPAEVERSAEASQAPADAVSSRPATGISPRARSLAQAKNFDAASVAEGTGPGGRVIERDMAAAIDAAPATRAGARAGGGSAGTGLGGRVTASDAARVEPTGEPHAAPAAPSVSAGSTTSLKGIRKVIAERMLNSLQTTAQVSYHTSANAEGLLALRKRMKQAPESLGLNSVTIGDLVGYATVRTLLRHPAHNAHLVGEEFTTFEAVHLGIAVDTPRGLLVPTVADASAMNLRRFAEVSKDLAQQAIGGAISPDLLQGATFTVSNLGSFGIEAFTPVLNAPQTAILGVATIMPRPTMADDGQVRIQPRLGLSLTADHRVIDGADAARFLQDLVVAIENIELTVMG